MESIIVAVITALTTIIGLWLKEYYFPKKSKHNITIEKSQTYIELDKYCYTIRKSVNADGVYIGSFHNGGHFITGIEMDKYTVVGEDYCEKLTSYKMKYKDRLINDVPYLFHNLIVKNKHAIPNTDTCEFNSRYYKDELAARNIKSVVSFLIKHPLTNKPIGFISIEYLKPYVYKEDYDREVYKLQNKIATLLIKNGK